MQDPLQRIKELQRTLLTGPNDKALTELLVLRSRVEGEQVYLDTLNDRQDWNRYSTSVQDQVIKMAERRLGENFQWTTTRLYECRNLSHRIASFLHTPTGALLNLIPGGTYQMGSDDTEDERAFRKEFQDRWERTNIEHESPKHTVRIPPMLIGRSALDKKSWAAFETSIEPKDDHKPMTLIGWVLCQDWLETVGDGLRLPSEAEWEYACRAGSTTRFYWGDEVDHSYCWSNLQKEHPTKSPLEKCNSFGLIDMLGNVWEWCQDAWVENYQTGPKDHNPRMRETANRVIRGGSRINSPGLCRSAYRFGYSPRNGHKTVGFRLAKSVPW